MKTLLLSALFCFAASCLFSQVQVNEGTVSFQNTNQPAAISEVPYAPDVVEKAITDYMLTKGYKASEVKGFKVFRGFTLNGGSTSDLYFKVEKKSKKEKDQSIVYMVVANSGEELKTRTTSDKYTLTGASEFVQGMIPHINDYNIGVEAAAQDEALKKAQKKYDNLIEENADLQKRKKRLEEDLEKNLKQQELQKAEVEKQRQVLEAIKAKRKPAN